MATELKEDSSLKRLIRVHGVDAPVIVEITRSGLRFWVKGSRKTISIGWVQAVESSCTPTDVPSYLMGKPFQLLQHQAARTRK